MHILITGAAGMVGRKLIERLVVDRALNGQPIDKPDIDGHRRRRPGSPAFPTARRCGPAIWLIPLLR